MHEWNESSAAARGVSSPRIGLLTGPVGVGKTTVAERVAGLAARHALRCGGLLAPALRDDRGQKLGIWGVDVRSGERQILARTDGELGGPRVGPYSFDARALAWAVGVIEQAAGRCDLLLADEIGKLELWQEAGLAPVIPWLAAGHARRALIVVRDTLLADLQHRLGLLDQVVFWASEQNRDALPAEILEQLMRSAEAG